MLCITILNSFILAILRPSFAIHPPLIEDGGLLAYCLLKNQRFYCVVRWNHWFLIFLLMVSYILSLLKKSLTCSNFERSLPAPLAKSGLPPPEPPNKEAISFTNLPAR